MYIDAIVKGNNFLTWIRDADGTLHEHSVPLEYWCYQSAVNGTHTSLFGDSLIRRDFDDYRDYQNFTYNSRNLFDSDVRPLYKMMSEYFYGAEDTPWNVGFFDIEYDYDLNDGRGYATIEDPFATINSISLYDVTKNEYHMVMLTNNSAPIDVIDTEDGIKVNSYNCVTERQLLDTFFKVITSIDVLSGWNSQQFDIPYIIGRCVKLYGFADAMKKFNRSGHSCSTYEAVDAFGNDYIYYELVGRQHFDYMVYYKNFILDPRPSYKLDVIGEIEVGRKKTEYEGDLGDLYRSNPKLFFEYSLNDVRLLKEIDEKLKLMSLVKAMGRRATCKYSDVLGSIKYLELSIRNYCLYDRKQVLIIPDLNRDQQREEFDGGYVLPTEKGAYKWVSSIDLASLYPSVIRSLCLSPETHILQCNHNKNDYIKIIEQRDEKVVVYDVKTYKATEFTGKSLYEYIQKNGYTISAYGSICDPSGQALIPEVLDLWYAERKAMKQKSLAYGKLTNDIDNILKNRQS